jgi:hypothetical protein
MATIRSSPFDLLQAHEARRPPAPAKGEEYLGLPVPMAWFAEAYRRGGSALAVGVALWFKAGVTKSRTIKLSHAVLAKVGVRPDAGRGGLQRLERKPALVSVNRHPGRSPIVTILNWGSNAAK